jgi:hypothetical protein
MLTSDTWIMYSISMYGQLFLGTAMQMCIVTLHLLYYLLPPLRKKEKKQENSLAPIRKGFQKYLCLTFPEI